MLTNCKEILLIEFEKLNKGGSKRNEQIFSTLEISKVPLCKLYEIM